MLRTERAEFIRLRYAAKYGPTRRVFAPLKKRHRPTRLLHARNCDNFGRPFSFAVSRHYIPDFERHPKSHFTIQRIDDPTPHLSQIALKMYNFNRMSWDHEFLRTTVLLTWEKLSARRYRDSKIT